MIVLTDKQQDILERMIAEKEKGHMDSLTMMKGLAAIAEVLLDCNLKKERPLTDSNYEVQLMEKFRK